MAFERFKKQNNTKQELPDLVSYNFSILFHGCLRFSGLSGFAIYNVGDIKHSRKVCIEIQTMELLFK